MSAEYKVGRGHRIDGNTAAVVATAAIDGRAPMSQSMALPRAESIRTLRPAIQCAAVRNGGEATPSEKKRVDGTCSIEKKKEKRTALGGVAEIWRQLQLESISYAVVNETPTGTLPSFSLNGARWPAALVFCLFVFFSVPFRFDELFRTRSGRSMTPYVGPLKRRNIQEERNPMTTWLAGFGLGVAAPLSCRWPSRRSGAAP